MTKKKKSTTLSLARRLEIVCAALSRRLDGSKFVFVRRDEKKDPPQDWEERVPKDFRDFAKEVTSCKLEYKHPSRPGRAMVALNIAPEYCTMKHLDTGLEPDEMTIDGVEHHFDHFGGLDRPADFQGSSWLAFEPDEGCSIVYFNEGDDTTQFADIEAYLTAGARRGFVDGWQASYPARGNPEWPKQRAERIAMIRKGSMSPETPLPKLVERLAKLDCIRSKEEAEQVVAWLGQDASILVDAENA